MRRDPRVHLLDALDAARAIQKRRVSSSATSWRPRTDSNRQYPRSALDWYLEVG